MHGFYQGAPTIEVLIRENNPDIFMLQEHWLTPMNLCLFEKHFDSYFAFGSSALVNCVESGMLRGRPFGGVITLINNKLVRLIALQYAARKCKQNKRYHTSASLTLAYNRKRKFNYFGCALVRRF